MPAEGSLPRVLRNVTFVQKTPSAQQMLHAWRLRLWHPVRHEQLSFEAPIPADMRAYLSPNL